MDQHILVDDGFVLKLTEPVSREVNQDDVGVAGLDVKVGAELGVDVLLESKQR